MTDRLVLRRWTDADREPFAAMNADPEVMRYFRDVLDREASDAFVDRIEASFDEHGYGLWVVERIDDGAFLGFTGLLLQTYESPFTPAVEVGWRLARDAWGNGYATEAGLASLAFGFDRLGLDAIISTTSRPNEPSQRVMQRLGMHRAGEFDFPLLPDGHPLQRFVVYRTTREQWAARV